MPRPIQSICVVIAAALATASPASARLLAPEAPASASIAEPVDAAPQTVAPPFNTPAEAPPTEVPPSRERSDLPRGEQPPRGMRGQVEPTSPHDQAPRMGLGLLISGIAATDMGCVFIVTSAGELAPGPSPAGAEDLEASDTAGLAGIGLGVGVAGMIAGLVMLPVGAVRLHRFRAWKRAHARPVVNRSAPGTWTVGLALRF